MNTDNAAKVTVWFLYNCSPNENYSPEIFLTKYHNAHIDTTLKIILAQDYF